MARMHVTFKKKLPVTAVFLLAAETALQVAVAPPGFRLASSAEALAGKALVGRSILYGPIIIGERLGLGLSHPSMIGKLTHPALPRRAPPSLQVFNLKV